MVIDTSALLAILFNESDAEYFESALDADTTRLISAASLLETAIVVDPSWRSRWPRTGSTLKRRK
jgi:ribonuclease VapC